ncbi:MAG: FtsW/RodA/SpoVE family cell cycle protein [Phycisphaerales bacterium]|nr:FtsW/RodA/SpoVE family cell cycle protein [Phycisphaerales bacterium]
MVRAGDVIILAVLALLCVGVIMVNSAEMTVDAQTGVTFKSILFSKASALALAAMVALLCARMLPVRCWASNPGLTRCIPLLLPIMLAALVLVYLPGVSGKAKGAARWLVLPGGITMQPSEVAKWGMPVVLAWYATMRGGALNRFWGGLVPALVVLGMVAAIVVLEDLGTGVVILSVGGLVLIAGGARIWHFVMIAPAPLALLGLAIIAEPYRVQRLITFANPYAEARGSGYQIIQSLAAIAGGGGTGRGLGFGLQKFGYLPEDRTDFLFAIICEELGVMGAALVLALYALLLFAGWSVVKNERRMLLKLSALGVIATVGIQAIMNLAVVTGLAPTKGIALPLLSAGGTGWILTAASLGVLASLDRSRPPISTDEARKPVEGQPTLFGSIEAKPIASAAAPATIAP